MGQALKGEPLVLPPAPRLTEVSGSISGTASDVNARQAPFYNWLTSPDPLGIGSGESISFTPAGFYPIAGNYVPDENGTAYQMIANPEGFAIGQQMAFDEQRKRDFASGNVGAIAFHLASDAAEISAPFLMLALPIPELGFGAFFEESGFLAEELGIVASRNAPKSVFPLGYQGGPGAMWTGEKLSSKIALGSRFSGLRRFAEKIDAEHLLGVEEHKWKEVFLDHVANPSTEFHVTMKGFYGDSAEEMIVNEMRDGSNTGWELQKLHESGRLPEVHFYDADDNLVINPFRK
jgi:hypothetical protein